MSIGSIPTPPPVGEANPPPPATGTNPGGSIDTAVPGSPAPTLEERRVAAMEAHAAAQADTAVAMRDAAAAQRELLTAMNAPPRPMSREALAFEILKAMPEVTGLTDLGLVDLAIKRADAFRQRCPAA